MTSPANAVPVYYLSAAFNAPSFIHRPNIARETNTAVRYRNTFPYATNVYAKINLSNGRFRTDDASEDKDIMIAIDTTDRGIPIRGHLEDAPFVFVDPTRVLTVFVKYSEDNTMRFSDGGHSYTISPAGIAPGTRINLTLRGHDVTRITPQFTLGESILPNYTEAAEESPIETSMLDSVYRIATVTGAIPRRTIRAAQDRCSLQ